MAKVFFYKAHLQDIDAVSVSDSTQALIEGLLASTPEAVFVVGNDEKPAYLDIVLHNDDYLFGRLGKEKDWRQFGYRNRSTRKYSPSLLPAELEIKALEASTYFLLAYDHNIISLINGQGAPGVGCIVDFITRNLPGYFLQCSPIVRPESIKALMKGGSALSKIKYTFALPSLEALEAVGLSKYQIAKLEDTQACEVDIVIKCQPRKVISSIKSQIEGIIESFSSPSDRANLKKLSFDGREDDMRSQSYNFEESKIQYSIDIPGETNKDGFKRLLSPDEVVEGIYGQLVELYTECSRDLLALTND